MQNIIEKFTLELTAHENKNVDEFNAVFDENDNLRSAVNKQDAVIKDQSAMILNLNDEVKKLSHLATVQDSALKSQDKDKSIFIKNISDLKIQSVAFQVENKNLKHQVEVLKKESKANKEQTKRNKAALAQRDAKLKKLAKPVKESGIKLHELNTIYCKGEDVLLIYPSKLTLGIDGVKQEQIALLYTDRKGCFTTAFLDNNDEVSFSTFISDKVEISEQTRKLINKNCMSISDEAAEFAQQWLYRVNRVQNMKLNQFDLTCHRD